MSEKFEFLLKWRSKLTKYVITHPLLKSRNLAFVCTKPAGNSIANSSIFAFAAKTGGLVWEHTFENTSISGICLYESPESKKQFCVLSLTSNDFLYGSGEVIAVNPAGEIVWRIKLSDKTVSAPVAHNGRLFVTDGGDSLTGINLENQEIVFEHVFSNVKSSLSAIAASGDTAFIPCRSAELIALDTMTGQLNWKFSLADLEPESGRAWLDKTPAINNDFLFIVSTKGDLICLNQDDGKVVWYKKIEPNAPLAHPTAGPQAVFVGGKSGISALDKNNGDQLWKHETTRRVSAQPQIVGNLLFAACEDHFVYVLDTQTGKVIASYEMERRLEIPVLVSSDGIYLVDRAADLRVFNFVPAQANLHVEKAVIINTAEEAKRLAKAGKWLEAAKVFEILDDFPARANALEEYALFVSTSGASDEDKAITWDNAADAFTESGDSDKKHICRIEAARYRKQPLFEFEIENSVFTIESWSRLSYKLTNIGFGLARYVGVLVQPDTVLFEWQEDSSDTSYSLQNEKELLGSLTIRPLNSGNGVPLNLMIEYLDIHDKRHVINKTFSVSVMSNQGETDRMIRERNFDGQGVAETPIKLRNIIVEAFDRKELDDIIYEINLNIDDFPGPLNTAARNFVDTVLRRGMTDKLLEIIVRERDYLAPK
ncbi:MAG: outer membrane protein assembly factor BamB [Cellvibrionaceae bacterium]|jgi:outer membrane protein assembly factor BamB